MNCTSFHENASAFSLSNVIPLAPHQRRARRQRRWAWWRGLLFDFGPAKEEQTTPMAVAGSGAVVNFRRQAGGARW